MRRFYFPILIATALSGCASLNSGEVARFASQVQALVQDMPEIRVQQTGNTVFLDGTLTTIEKARRLEKIVAALHETTQPGAAQVSSLVKLDPKVLNAIAERIEREIGSPEISVSMRHHTLVLEGTAQNDFEADRAVELAQTYMFEKTISSVQSVSNASREVTTTHSGPAATAYVIPVVTVLDMMRVKPRPAPTVKGKLSRN